MTHAADDSAWRAHLLQTDTDIDGLLEHTHRIAVLGIKPEIRADRPAFFVPEYVQRAGFEVIPVPVYYPNVTHILGVPVYRRLTDVPGSIDLVNIFRRPEHVAQHLEDILAAKPRAVWMQSGIRHLGVAEALARAGIDVVQDRCLMVELSIRGR
jgi:predicted CoA-binding protein